MKREMNLGHEDELQQIPQPRIMAKRVMTAMMIPVKLAVANETMNFVSLCPPATVKKVNGI